MHIGEFREFGELFSGDKASLDSQLTILTNNQGYATKVFRLDENGQLKKRSAANIYEGHAKGFHSRPGQTMVYQGSACFV